MIAQYLIGQPVVMDPYKWIALGTIAAMYLVVGIKFYIEGRQEKKRNHAEHRQPTARAISTLQNQRRSARDTQAKLQALEQQRVTRPKEAISVASQLICPGCGAHVQLPEVPKRPTIDCHQCGAHLVEPRRISAANSRRIGLRPVSFRIVAPILTLLSAASFIGGALILLLLIID